MPPSPLRIDINGAGGRPQPLYDDLPQVDMPSDSLANGVDLTGMDDIANARAALPPDPMDSLSGASDAIINPLSTLMTRAMGAPDRLQGALADSEDQSNRGRGELDAMRSHIYQGDPWLAFAGAVMQPNRGGAMAAMGQGITALNSGLERRAAQEQNVDRLLSSYDNTQAQQNFKNRMGTEEFGLNSIGAGSKLAAVRMTLQQWRMKMALLQGMLNDGTPGAPGASGAPGAAGAQGGGAAPDPYASLQRAFAIQSATGMPAMKAWALAHPDLSIQNNGKYLFAIDPKTNKVIGQPIPMQVAPGQAAQMAQHAAEFKANTGVDLPGGSSESPVNSGAAAPGANVVPPSAPAASPNAPTPNAVPGADQQGNPASPNGDTTQSQGFNSTQPDQAGIEKNVDSYVSTLGLPAAKVNDAKSKLMLAQPKNLDAVRQTIDTTNSVMQNADSIINRVSGDKNLQAGPIGNALSYIWGTNQYDTSKQLESIKHNLMRDAIEALRSLSTNGSLNMRITQSELENMQSRIANVSLAQSPSQFLGNLRSIRDHFLQMQGRARQGYERIYGAAPDATLNVKKFYATEADAEAAAKAGEIKSGDKVTVGGRTGTWQ